MSSLAGVRRKGSAVGEFAASPRQFSDRSKPPLTTAVGPKLIPPGYQTAQMNPTGGSMQGREGQAAWRLFEINWLVLAAMAAVLALAVVLSRFSFQPEGAIVSYGFVAIYAAFAYYNAKAPHRRDPQVVYVLGATAQLVFATVILAPLSYVAASANLPLQDANLYAIDQALGLDWKAYITFVNAHPMLAEWLRLGYSMIQWPIFLLPVVLCAAHQYRRLQEFILAFTLALIITVALSIFVPAIGVFYHLDLSPAD